MIDFSEEYALIEEYEDEYEDDPFTEAVYMTMIEYYRQYFDEGPPVMQMRGGILEQASLMLHAIERGSPIADDEVLNDPDVLY